MRPPSLLAILGAMLALGPTGATCQSAPVGKGWSISVRDIPPVTPSAPRRYDVDVVGVDVRDVLGTLLGRAEVRYRLHDGVAGAVSLTARNATLEELLDSVRAVAHPPIRFVRGEVLEVALATGPDGGPAGQSARSALASRPTDATPRTLPPGFLLRSVTLDIPDARPVTLRRAMQMVEAQTGVRIVLDPRIPRDLGFAAQMGSASLQTVLDTLSRTGAFKWTVRTDGAVEVSPSDWLRVTVGGTAIAGGGSSPCTRCGRPVLSAWRFCPFDGQPALPQPQPAGSQRPR